MIAASAFLPPLLEAAAEEKSPKVKPLLEAALLGCDASRLNQLLVSTPPEAEVALQCTLLMAAGGVHVNLRASAVIYNQICGARNSHDRLARHQELQDDTHSDQLAEPVCELLVYGLTASAQFPLTVPLPVTGIPPPMWTNGQAYVYTYHASLHAPKSELPVTSRSY